MALLRAWFALVPPWNIRATMFEGVAYLSVASSLLIEPPKRSRGQVSPLETVAAPWLWVFAFLLVGVTMIIVGWRHPTMAYVAQGFAGTITGCFFIATVAASIHNHTGWLLPSAFFALSAAHWKANRTWNAKSDGAPATRRAEAR
jgi:hypothetical protein